MQKIKKIKRLYCELLSILKKQDDNLELRYIISKIEVSIELINDYLNNYNNFEKQNVLNELVSLYKNINKPRVGLSSYFIWKDDYEERIQINAPLDDIKNRLSKIFNNIM